MVLRDSAKIKQFFRTLNENKHRVIPTLDTETDGVHPYKGNRICGVVAYTPAYKGGPVYIPVRHAGANADIDVVMKCVETVVSDSSGVVGGHNFKFDHHFFHMEGLDVKCRVLDTQIGCHLADENDCAFHWGRLEELCEHHIDKSAGDALRAMTAKYGPKFKERMATFTAEEVHDYGTADGTNTFALMNNVRDRLHSQDPRLVNIWKEYSDYHHCITAMERAGMPVAVDKVKKRIPLAQKAKEKVLAEVRDMCGFDYNPNSHPQTRRLLGLPDGHTTDKDFLEIGRAHV